MNDSIFVITRSDGMPMMAYLSRALAIDCANDLGKEAQTGLTYTVREFVPKGSYTSEWYYRTGVDFNGIWFAEDVNVPHQPGDIKGLDVSHFP